jgi:hypothetical protein
MQVRKQLNNGTLKDIPGKRGFKSNIAQIPKLSDWKIGGMYMKTKNSKYVVHNLYMYRDYEHFSDDNPFKNYEHRIEVDPVTKEEKKTYRAVVKIKFEC